MGVMLENLTLQHMLVQHLWTIILIAGPDDMVVGALDDADRIKLNKPQIMDELPQIQRTGGRFPQTL